MTQTMSRQVSRPLKVLTNPGVQGNLETRSLSAATSVRSWVISPRSAVEALSHLKILTVQQQKQELQDLPCLEE